MVIMAAIILASRCHSAGVEAGAAVVGAAAAGMEGEDSTAEAAGIIKLKIVYILKGVFGFSAKRRDLFLA